RFRRVRERRILLVHAPRLSVHVGAVLEGVEDLHLVALLEEHAAVALLLPLALHHRRTPLDVQLHAAEAALRLDAAGTGHHAQDAAVELPAGRVGRLTALRAARPGGPFGEVIAEQHD